MVDSGDSGSNPQGNGGKARFLAPLQDFLADKGKGRDRQSGTYRRNLERDVERFSDWFEDRHGHRPTFGDLSDLHFRRYARALTITRDPEEARDPVEKKEYAPGTALTYYANLSAYIGWCVDEGFLENHLAQTDRATEPLPEDDGRRSGDQQAWTSEQRQQLMRHMNERGHAVVDEPGEGEIDEWAVLKVRRDRALIATLAYTGIRGGELVAHPEDDRRNGVTWGDIDLDDAKITVLAKRQTTTWSDRSLPEYARDPLGMLKRVLEPPNDDWPVFPTLHRPTLYEQLREALTAAGVPEDDQKELIRADPFGCCREYDVVPPSITTDGARAILRRRCEEAGIDLADETDYLQPHGARRGIGEVMVRQKGFAAAARMLDDSERMVRERYSHIEAGELAEEATEAIGAEDTNAFRGEDK